MESRELKLKAKNSLSGNWGTAIAITLLYGIISGAASQMAVVGTIFLAFPLYVGLVRYYMAVTKGYGEFDDLFASFRDNYMDNAVTILLQNVFILLWSLLLIIPGIVKTISYSMTPYIINDSDYNVYGNDAIQMSMNMMEGHKWIYFKLMFSFIGWHLLGILTFGILHILFIQPYIYSTQAQFYYELKGLISDGIAQSKIAEEIMPTQDDEFDSWDL